MNFLKVLIPSFLILFSSCASVPVVTHVYIKNRINSLEIGESKEEVLKTVGEPLFFTVIPRKGEESLEIYGFEMGHYWKHEAPVVIFKHERLVGVASDAYELMQILRDYDALSEHAMFWHMNTEREDDYIEESDE